MTVARMNLLLAQVQETEPEVNLEEISLRVGNLGDPQLWWITLAVCVVALIAFFVLLYTTRAGIIARATTKEAVRQPLFYLLIALAILLNGLNTIVPFFSLGDDVKMLMDCGLATILIAGLMQAVWTASTSIADEIEGKTAMTLLSKPINRLQFVLGKYLGILTSVGWMMVPIVLTFLALIYYKVGYDSKESSTAAEMPDRIAAIVLTLPNLLLIFMEIAVLTAVSVVISTRLPMVVNMVITFAIFVVGNLTPMLVQTGVLKLEFVQFTARLIATLLPSLELYNTQTAVAIGTIVPPPYLGLAAIYSICYAGAALLLAFLLFEDRDLA